MKEILARGCKNKYDAANPWKGMHVWAYQKEAKKNIVRELNKQTCSPFSFGWLSSKSNERSGTPQ